VSGDQAKDNLEDNQELQNRVKNLEWTPSEKQNIIVHMVDIIQSTKVLRDEIEMKDQLIDAL
jgi:hypothetical protein